MTKKSKQARAREFNTTSRQSIKERDQNQCIFCQMEYRMEEVEWTGQGTLSIMHYIPRSHGGLGIPQNGALGCISHGQGTGQDIEEPLDTVTSRDRFGLVTIEGVDYQIVDIGLRMLEPKELYGCQGFPEDYIIDHDYTGKTYPRSEQVRRCGNAVCPPIPAALVRANLPELCVAERTPNMMIKAEQTGQLRFA